jgi:phosphoribosyl-ATP pyrophosphohydrolase/phosphoribosyl-AMP cyclohydrolase
LICGIMRPMKGLKLKRKKPVRSFAARGAGLGGIGASDPPDRDEVGALRPPKLKDLIPVVVQDIKTLRVLMVAHMNRLALQKTLTTGRVHFWSRSRRKLWMKGESSGNALCLREAWLDCDGDALLLLVEPSGPVCHTGEPACFFQRLRNGTIEQLPTPPSLSQMLERIHTVILDRKQRPRKDSYVSSLLSAGRDRILKKIGEEAGELIIGSKNGRSQEILSEAADLWFHTLILLGHHGLTPKDVANELAGRFGRSGIRTRRNT